MIWLVIMVTMVVVIVVMVVVVVEEEVVVEEVVILGIERRPLPLLGEDSKLYCYFHLVSPPYISSKPGGRVGM